MKNLLVTVSPHVSGPYTFFITLKNGMKKYGWNVMGLNLTDKTEADGFIAISPSEQDVINDELALLLSKYHIDVFLPISYIEFHIAARHIKTHTKIIKVSMVLNYDILLINRDYTDMFVVTTPRQYSDLINLGIESNKLQIIPFSTYLYGTKTNKNESVKLGFIGRISHPRKGVLFIPRIFSSIRKKQKNVKLKYLGGGQDLNALKMMHFFDRLANRVEFTGMFQIEDIPRLASDIDIFLMPSKSEGFGIVLIEAMSMGIVPIVSRIEGVTDWIVEDGLSGFVVDRNEKTFVEKALYLIENPKKRKAMAKQARQRVVEMFTVEIVSERYAELLEKVLDLPDINTSNLTPEKIEPLKTPKAKKKKMSFIPDFVKNIYKVINIKRTRF
ncbi:glycosyltransferase family 4 protein [Lunatimonas salinarum]|uniref:glycosyltransferase family 4 protein n=1 Tax=Lunatimonas salinarum TaxID=1774590 RepID=UPI001ADF199E|nr:glycosyltransferase family 4 protein [Lunatimonas salinarum]